MPEDTPSNQTQIVHGFYTIHARDFLVHAGADLRPGPDLPANVSILATGGAGSVTIYAGGSSGSLRMQARNTVISAIGNDKEGELELLNAIDGTIAIRQGADPESPQIVLDQKKASGQPASQTIKMQAGPEQGGSHLNLDADSKKGIVASVGAVPKLQIQESGITIQANEQPVSKIEVLKDSIKISVGGDNGSTLELTSTGITASFGGGNSQIKIDAQGIKIQGTKIEEKALASLKQEALQWETAAQAMGKLTGALLQQG